MRPQTWLWVFVLHDRSTSDRNVTAFASHYKVLLSANRSSAQQLKAVLTTPQFRYAILLDGGDKSAVEKQRLGIPRLGARKTRKLCRCVLAW